MAEAILAKGRHPDQDLLRGASTEQQQQRPSVPPLSTPLPPPDRAPRSLASARNRVQHAAGAQATTAAKLAAGIVAISHMMSAIVAKTGDAASSAIQGWVDDRITTTRPGQEQLQLSPLLTTRLGYAAKVTSPGAHLFAQLANVMGDVFYWFVLWAARVYEQVSGRSGGGGGSGKLGMLSHDELHAFKLVGAALLVGWVEVYDAVEGAIRALCGRAGAAGQRYLAHRYGEEAAGASLAGLAVAQDLGSIALCWFRMLGRALVSRTARGGACDFLRAHVPNVHLD